MAAQVDGARRDVDVHEVVHDPTLDVVQHPVDHVPLTNIHDLDVGKIPKALIQQEKRGDPLLFIHPSCNNLHPEPESTRVFGRRLARISPVQHLVQRLVGVLVALDSLHEVFYRFFCVAVCVVGATQLDLLQHHKHQLGERVAKNVFFFRKNEAKSAKRHSPLCSPE